MKKFLSVLIVSLMIFALVPFAASAESVDVIVAVADGGSVEANGVEIYGGESVVSVTNGTLNCVSTSYDTSKVVRAFVNGEEIPAPNGEFSVNNVTSATRVYVAFAYLYVDDMGIEIDDVDWTAENIVIPVSSSEPVVDEVFHKIAAIPEGKFVEFKSALGSIFIPTGRLMYFVETSYMNVGDIVGGNRYENIRSAMQLRGEENTNFAAFGFLASCVFPSGTEVSFNLGEKYANSTTQVFDYDDDLKYVYSKAEVGVSETGVTERIVYDNESVLVCALNEAIRYSIYISANGEGGSVSPEGVQSVIYKDSLEVNAKADEGFVIKRILVDGAEIEIEKNLTDYTHSFSEVEANHTFSVEFKEKEAEPVTIIVNVDDDIDVDPTDESKTELRPIAIFLIIVGVLLLLFGLLIIIIVIIIVAMRKKKKKRERLAAENVAAANVAPAAGAAEENAENSNPEIVEGSVADDAVCAAAAKDASECADESDGANDEAPAVAADVSEFKFCSNCGTKLEPNSEICHNCGNKQ